MVHEDTSYYSVEGMQQPCRWASPSGASSMEPKWDKISSLTIEQFERTVFDEFRWQPVSQFDNTVEQFEPAYTRRMDTLCLCRVVPFFWRWTASQNLDDYFSLRHSDRSIILPVGSAITAPCSEAIGWHLINQVVSLVVCTSMLAYLKLGEK